MTDRQLVALTVLGSLVVEQGDWYGPKKRDEQIKRAFEYADQFLSFEQQATTEAETLKTPNGCGCTSCVLGTTMAFERKE